MRQPLLAHAAGRVRAPPGAGLDVAFLDQRIPRYERDIINMVGMGVTENSALKPNVKEGATGFSVTYIRAKTGKGALGAYDREADEARKTAMRDLLYRKDS